jgi:threonine/homoserine/homoserine lactone efflux protein
MASGMLEALFSGPPNLSMTERAMYIALGLGIAAAGAKPRPNPLLNVLALAGGSYLAWTGYQGHCPMKAALAPGGKGPDLIAKQH